MEVDHRWRIHIRVPHQQNRSSKCLTSIRVKPYSKVPIFSSNENILASWQKSRCVWIFTKETVQNKCRLLHSTDKLMQNDSFSAMGFIQFLPLNAVSPFFILLSNNHYPYNNHTQLTVTNQQVLHSSWAVCQQNVITHDSPRISLMVHSSGTSLSIAFRGCAGTRRALP